MPPWGFGLACGLLVSSVLFSPALILQMGGVESLEILGNALFFGFSVAIVAGATPSILEGAARDLTALRSVLTIDEEGLNVLIQGLTRQSSRLSAFLLTCGLVAGLTHNYLLGQHLNAMPFLLTQTSATVLMWVVMLLTLPKIIRNAVLFSRLGKSASPDLLRPSRHSAFGSAALRPGVYQIGIICMYGFLLLGDSSPFDDGVWIGIAASAATLFPVVILPLLGIRARIREARQSSLAMLDERINALEVGDLSTAGVDTLDAMDTLLDMRERVVRAPGWPLDLAGVKRILLYIVLPPLTWAAAAVVEMLIDGALS
ncbi:MAG: hypothetical protein Cons2KO_28430 [Congregibacter sp.]